MDSNRLTAGQLLEALAGVDPATVVVTEGLYIGPGPTAAPKASALDRYAAASECFAIAERLRRLAVATEKVRKGR